MSENSDQKPTLQAGDPIVSMCPICKAGFQEPMKTGIKIECPDPSCGRTFLVMVY